MNWEFLKRQLVYRTTRTRTTWKLRLLVCGLLLLVVMATRGWWVPAVGWSLVCDSDFDKPDLIYIDNLDHNFHLFAMADDLKRSGVGEWVLVPIAASAHNPEKPGLVAGAMAETMVRLARLESVVLLPVRGGEPITLNVAREVREFLKGTKAKKVLILTSGFKSKRFYLIFSKVLSEAGIDVYCLPVWGEYRPETWAASWHGIQEVALQLVKLGYYRIRWLGGKTVNEKTVNR